jgi:hypothetical protein
VIPPISTKQTITSNIKTFNTKTTMRYGDDDDDDDDDEVDDDNANSFCKIKSAK